MFTSRIIYITSIHLPPHHTPVHKTHLYNDSYDMYMLLAFYQSVPFINGAARSVNEAALVVCAPVYKWGRNVEMGEIYDFNYNLCNWFLERATIIAHSGNILWPARWLSWPLRVISDNRGHGDYNWRSWSCVHIFTDGETPHLCLSVDLIDDYASDNTVNRQLIQTLIAQCYR